jgi:transcriptional regulator with XRE-family HTH domain
MSVRHTPNPLAGRLRLIRKRRGLTQEQLAERAGVTHGTISRLETGKLGASQALLIDLAAALGISLAELVSADPTETIFDLWERIDASKRPQALKVLETFVDAANEQQPSPPKEKRRGKP